MRPWLVPKIRPSDLAREAGVSHQYVSQVLSGHKPASEKIIDAAGELGLPIEDLFPNHRKD